jgi:hypothetical protein
MHKYVELALTAATPRDELGAAGLDLFGIDGAWLKRHSVLGVASRRD